MATAATSLLGLALPVTGELSGTWGDTVNVSITALLDSAVAGTTTLSSDADVTLTTTTLAANQARQAIILWTAGGTATRTITAPAQSKAYIVINKTSSSQSIKIVGAGPTTGVTIVAGTAAFVVWNGVDFVTASVTSTTGVLPVANGGTGVTTSTGTGSVVLNTSPTLVTPVLGTPASGTVTNLTGTASININGTVGATTATTGAFTTLSATGAITSTTQTATPVAVASPAYKAVLANVAGQYGLGVTWNTASNSPAINILQTNVGGNGAAGSSLLYIDNRGTVNDSIHVQNNGTSLFQVAYSGAVTIGGTLSGGTSGTGYSFSGSAPAGSLTLDTSGNLGLGVAPSAYNSRGFDISSFVGLSQNSAGAATLAFNNFQNSAGNYIYKTTNPAAKYECGATGSGVHAWYNAPSGTAGNPITFTQAMTLDANSSLAVGGTTVVTSNGGVTANTTSSGSIATSFAMRNAGTANGSGSYLNFRGVSNTSAEHDYCYLAMVADDTTAKLGSIRFSTTAGSAPVERARIDSSGNFQLSTASTGILASDGYTMLNQTSSVITVGATNRSLAFATSASATAAILDTSGNLGLGVTPSASLSTRKVFQFGATGSVANNSGNTLLGDNYYTDNTPANIYLTTGFATAYQQTTGEHRWLTAASGTAGNPISFTQAMTLDASGNLGIGTTSPGAKLDVTGDITISNSANAATANFFNTNASLTTQVIQSIAVKAAGTDFTLFRGTSNSSVHVFNVFGNGNVTNTNNSYAGISDVKLKENIVDATPKLANLMQVKVRNYNLKSDPSFKQIGVIAQELETIFPALVEETKDSDVKGNDLGTTTKSVKYSVFVPMLIKAIQEQQALITQLTARITALETP